MNIKKLASFLFLIGISFTQIPEIQAKYTGACVQKNQAAISSFGECKVFSNPCNVPNEWKHISSCENFSSKEIEGKSIEETNDRRFNIAKWKEKRKAMPKKKKRVLKRRITGGTWNRISSEKADLTEKKQTRNFSEKKYFSRKTLEERRDRTQTPYQRTARKKLGTASAPKNKRNISTKKWTLNKKGHSTKRNYSKKPVWRSARSLKNEERASKKKVRKPRSATLRQVWVGARRNGKID